ncbi:MAG TPA: RHS repeat-associated core domain-containing protein [Candidatus Acidoferrales bacterium]|nr:RHS repeat-associated core domain-containing protein [Candidatus Acidoferrales bacterium]
MAHPSMFKGAVLLSIFRLAEQNLSVSATTKDQLSFTGAAYDAAGNMLTDGTNTYGYNAESEIKSAAGVTYTYDGDGNRVEKSSGTLYWYGLNSAPLEETNLTGGMLRDYIFFDGARISVYTPTSTVLGFFDDHLGSTSKLEEVSSSGTVSQGFDSDYYPFGRAHQFKDSYDPAFKFMGKERDEETGLDNFGARYNDSTIGRFISADWSSVPEAVPYANLTNPQTLNLYAMVSDNPETFADLDGHLSGTEGLCWVDFCAGSTQTEAAREGDGPPAPSNTGDGQQLSNSQQAAGANANVQSDQQKAKEQKKPGFWKRTWNWLTHHKTEVVVQVMIMAATDGAAGPEEVAGDVAEATAETVGESVGTAGEAAEAGFADDSSLAAHFEKHGAEFGAKSEGEYEALAKDFLSGPKLEGVLEKVRPNGDILRYNPATNEFGVISKSGAIRTFFKPTNGLAYFNAQ